MGKVKDLRRRQRAVNLKEKRLRRQRQLPGEAMERAIEEAKQQGFDQGYRLGRVEGIGECLAKTKEFKTVTSIRRSLGALHRAARGRA